jgi:periplasmic protein TonB
MYASPARSTLLSGALHAAAIALILFTTGVKPSLVKSTGHTTLITPLDLLKYDITAPQRDDAGGGGGMRAKTAASIGNLPTRALKQFLAPMVKSENSNPILTIEPTIIADPEIAVPQLNLAQFGDPHGVPGPPSAGRGGGGGIGDGYGTGVGPGEGAGAGPGRDGGIASGQLGFQGSRTEPVLLWKAEPEYSDEARKAKMQGSVIMHVEIDVRGQVQNIAVAQGLGLGLDERAIAAVRKWKFRAGTRNGKPVPTNALIQVTFRLL